MKLILPYFILILFLLQHNMKKNSKKEKINNETFWKRESEANSVRKKDISGLDRKSTRLNSSHNRESRMPSSA